MRKNICLQSFPRWVRAALGSPFYCDIDIVNCHPTLLLGWKNLLIKNNFDVVSLPLYCKYRDEVLDFLVELLKIESLQGGHENSRKFAKKLLAVLMYGGSMKSWKVSIQGEATCEIVNDAEKVHPTSSKIAKFSLEEFINEILKIGKYLIDFTLLSVDSEDAEEDQCLASHMLSLLKSVHAQNCQNERKEVFRFMSLLLQETERMVLSEIEYSLYNTEETQPIPMDVLIHDGGLVRRRVDTPTDFCGSKRFLNYPFDKYLDQKDLDKLEFESLRSAPLHRKLINNPLAFTQEASKIFSIDIRLIYKPLDLTVYDLKMQTHFCVPRPILRTYTENKYFLEEERHLAYITKGNAYIYNGEYITEECLRKQLTDLYFIGSNAHNQLSNESSHKSISTTASAQRTVINPNPLFHLDPDTNDSESRLSTDNSSVDDAQSGIFSLPRPGRLRTIPGNKRLKKNMRR